MQILHGTWYPEFTQFVLWGEDSTITSNRRKGKRGTLAPHPFLTTTNLLLRILTQVATDPQPDGRSLTIWLPGIGKSPVPSPEAQSVGVSPPEGDPELLGWIVKECLTLKPTDALDFLLQIPPEHEGSLGFMLGGDLVFWQQAALVTMNTLVKQGYLPSIEPHGGHFAAYWQPQPDPDLAAQMAVNMPPVCRAVIDNPSHAPQPHDLLDSFLRHTVDAFIREAFHQGAKPKHRWLKALTSESATVNGSDVENRKLHEMWQQWQAAATGISAGGFRTSFRLEEPEKDGDPWFLRYLIQAVNDPSLIVEAEVVWKSSGRTLEYLEYRFDQPQERLLRALGVASNIFQPIERSLHTASPSGVSLNPDEVYQFLLEALPMLEQNQFGVLVPNWWQRAGRLKAKVSLEGADTKEPTGFLGMDSLARYKWELSLGGEPISRQEFEELVALKQPLVRYRGQWVALDPDHVESALRFFEKQSQTGEMDMLDALKLSAGATDSMVEGIEIESIEVNGWLQNLLQRLRDPAQNTPPSIPDSMHATLRHYQVRGFGWIAQMREMGLGACLADDMGLGKTPQTITLWLHERDHLGISRPALLVCPTSVIGNWRHELQRFAPSLRVMAHHGPDRQQGEDFAKAVEQADVVITSYPLLARDCETFAAVRWAGVVLDEAQNIKNPSTRQAQAARALTADHRLALTGTPIENRLSELWSIMQFLNPDYLGSQQAFRSSFAIPIERYNSVTAAETLKQLVNPFILRRVKTDPNIISDLPEKFENKVYCTLTTEQATLYEAVVKEELEAIQSAEDQIHRQGNVLRMLTRLKQVCNHPAHFLKEAGQDGVTDLRGRSGKLNRLTEMLEELIDAGDSALIFTQYAQMGHLLQPYLEESLGSEILFLHGGTPSQQREEIIQRFQAPHGPALFILSLKAGGTGLNLTRANHVFHFDRWYNPAVENQATDRAFRIGQTKNVQVHKYICLGTLEERIDQMIEHKKALADSIVGAGENWISEMSDTDLRELVTLRRDAVEEGD